MGAGLAVGSSPPPPRAPDLLDAGWRLFPCESSAPRWPNVGRAVGPALGKTWFSSLAGFLGACLSQPQSSQDALQAKPGPSQRSGGRTAVAQALDSAARWPGAGGSALASQPRFPVNGDNILPRVRSTAGQWAGTPRRAQGTRFTLGFRAGQPCPSPDLPQSVVCARLHPCQPAWGLGLELLLGSTQSPADPLCAQLCRIRAPQEYLKVKTAPRGNS